MQNNTEKKLQDQLGACTWAFMHTVAAQYPNKPTQSQQLHIKQLIYRIAEFYPCRWCAKDFAESIRNNPIKTDSKEALSIWLCERHNEVNDKIGKPIVPNCKEAWKKWLTEDEPENNVEEDSSMKWLQNQEFDDKKITNKLSKLKIRDNTEDELDFKPPSTEDLLGDCKFCEQTMGKERYDKLKSLLKTQNKN
ncbi:hypothetical protein ABK040_013787 [Willaertia magna]